MPDDTNAQANPAGSETGDSANTFRMPLTEHLEELRQCMIRALVGLTIAIILSFAFVEHLIAIILSPAIEALQRHGERPEFLSLSPPEPFLLAIRVAIYAGIVISMPWIMHQAWTFVSAGLYARERRFAKRFLPISAVLFAAGVAFMYFVVLPLVLGVLIEFSQGIRVPGIFEDSPPELTTDAADSESPDPSIMPILMADPPDPRIGQVWYNAVENASKIKTEKGIMVSAYRPGTGDRIIASQYRLQDFVSFTLTLAIAFGIAFQLPVLVVFLAATGIVEAREMARARRYILFGIIVASAMLTPPDPASQFLLAGPMYLLFEAGLFFAGRFDVPASSG